MPALKLKPAVKNAIMIGAMCSLSYLSVYFVRNTLSAVAPQMTETGAFTTEQIGTLSSLYFITYAVGQLINGAIGDKIHAKYMISLGLIMAGVCNVIFTLFSTSLMTAYITYGLCGYFLSTVYGPMTKVVSENTEPIYATRCTLGYTFASFVGTPLAGLLAVVLAWQGVFHAGSFALLLMGVVCFTVFCFFERAGIVRYGQYQKPRQRGAGGIRVLIRHQIIKYTIVSILTGVVRTTVVFWLPTYLSQYLGFSSDTAALIFTVATFIISLTAFIAVFIYERLGRNMDLTVLLAFIGSTIGFVAVYLIKLPALNVIFLVLAIMSANCASSMLWSRYCPGLRDTGMVSSATGFLDFMSYGAASVSSTLFANAVSSIGWGNLILVWLGLMAIGIVVTLPRRKRTAAVQ